MLTMEEATRKALLDEGQILVPMSAFTYTSQDLQTIFYTTIKEFSAHCPFRDVQRLYLNNYAQVIDCQEILSLKIFSNYNYNRYVPYLDAKYWQWRQDKKELNTLIAGDFEVTLLRDYKAQNLELSYEGNYKGLSQTNMFFSIRGEPSEGSLLISLNGYIMVEISRTDTEITLGGTLGTGTINISRDEAHLATNLIFDAGVATETGVITIDMITKYIGVLELDLGHRFFHQMYAGNLLTSLGSVKEQTKLEANLPFDITTDVLLDRGRTLKDEIRTGRIADESYWYKII